MEAAPKIQYLWWASVSNPVWNITESNTHHTYSYTTPGHPLPSPVALLLCIKLLITHGHSLAPFLALALLLLLFRIITLHCSQPGVTAPRTWGHIYKMVSVPLISAVRVCFNTTQNQNLNTEKAIFTKLPFNYNISFVVKRHIFWIIHCVSLCSNGVSKINYMDTYRMKYQMKRRVLAPHPCHPAVV